MSKYHALIYRNLASLNESGVDLRKSLKISNCGPERYQKAMDKASKEIQKGNNIADGLELSPDLFSKTDIEIIRASEATGSLPFALRILAKEHETRKSIVMDALGRFTYTIILFHASALLLNIIYTIINYQFDFSGFPIRLLLTLSVLYVPAGAIYYICKKTPQSGPARTMLDSLVLKIPGLRSAVRSIALGRFSRTINLCYRAGMEEDKSLKTAASVTGNVFISKMFDKCKEAVFNGKPVSEGFSRSLPLVFTEQWKVGELAGTMEATTEKLAEIYEEEGTFKLKAFCATVNFIFYLLMIIAVALGILYVAGKVYSIAY